MAGQREAQGGNGADPYPDAPREPADAAGLHRQSCRDCCQQNVRMRIGAVMMYARVRLLRFASIGSRMGRALALALALAAFIGQNAYAQQSTQQPKTPKRPQVAKMEAPAPPPVQMTIEPKAIEILKAACDRIAAARSMRFTAVVTYENPSRLGTPLAYTTKSEVTLQRPDKLRVITPADGPATEFYYDGKVMMAFAPAENLIAV